MPYIHKEMRKIVDMTMVADNAGELNYLITTLIIDYHLRKGGNYQAINDVVGALEGAKFEFYRRVAAPYEDLKIKQNGDVY